MPYILKTIDEVTQSLQSYFTAAGFDNVVAGTPEHALLNMLSIVIYNIYTDLDTTYNTLLPLDAQGADLDLWASFFGIVRGTENIAKDDSTNNVHFFIADSNRSTVNSGAAVVVPEGAIITNDTAGKRYKTTADVTIPATAPSVVFVPVEALTLGAFMNVVENELIKHELEDSLDLTDAEIELIEVSNKFAIASGTLTQRDSDLQLALQDIFGENIGTNKEGLISLLFDLPGVANATLLPAKRGTGTFNVFIDSTSPIVSPLLIQEVQAVIDREVALGVKGYVEYPTYKAVTIDIEVLARDGVVAADLLTSLGGSTTTDIMNTINNIGRGASLDPIILLRLALDHEDILNAKVKELKIGNYSVLEDKIINNEIVGLGRKKLTEFEKWFSSSDLISFCVAEYE
jgi:hypothetical protein|tara:strand:- start:334 stop:1539 length:1206 start_codon:yes stop_codon:yes gene_type:complete